MKYAALAFLLIATPAMAESIPCGNGIPMSPQKLKQFVARFSESPAAVGITSRGDKFLIISNSETGSFTVLEVLANGLSCIVMSGVNFETVLQVPAIDGKDM